MFCKNSSWDRGLAMQTPVIEFTDWLCGLDKFEILQKQRCFFILFYYAINKNFGSCTLCCTVGADLAIYKMAKLSLWF